MKLTKDNWKDVTQHVRRVLLSTWDPIGVGDNPKLSDEYDSYLSGIVSCGQSDDPTEAIYEALGRIEAGLGMSVEEDARRRAAVEIAEVLC